MTTSASGADAGTVGTPREAAALERARTVSRLFDEAFRVPGTDYRIGLDPILGILPVSGDAVAGLASLYVIYQAIRVGVPWPTIAVMLVLVAVDFLAGSVPFVGPFVDAVVKVNKRNTELLAAHVESPPA